MATIRCANCGRYIQDSDKTCLYCNTPNAQYKESIYESSFGLFGSSLGSGSFSTGSFSTIKSSFDPNNTPTDFNVGKDTQIAPQTEKEDKEEFSSFGRMSNFFDCPAEQKEDAKQEIQPITMEPKSSQQKPVSYTPTDFKEKLDAYRKQHGYGEYAPKASRSHSNEYTPPRSKKLNKVYLLGWQYS